MLLCISAFLSVPLPDSASQPAGSPGSSLDLLITHVRGDSRHGVAELTALLARDGLQEHPLNATCFTALLRRSTSNKNSIHSLER